LRRVAKVIVGEGLGKRLCPGEDKCAKFKSSIDEDVCEKCSQNLAKQRLSSIEGYAAVVPWVSHLLYIYSLVQVGVSFGIDDLNREEWNGLLMLESVKGELEQERLDKMRLEQKVASARSRK
jgi:hypothetical protein